MEKIINKISVILAVFSIVLSGILLKSNYIRIENPARLWFIAKISLIISSCLFVAVLLLKNNLKLDQRNLIFLIGCLFINICLSGITLLRIVAWV